MLEGVRGRFASFRNEREPGPNPTQASWRGPPTWRFPLFFRAARADPSIEMGDITFRQSSGVLTSTWTGELTEAEVQHAFDRIDQMLAHQRSFAHVVDARFVGKVSAGVRDLGVRRLKGTGAQRRLFVRGEAVVLSSALVRGVLAAMYLLSRPGYPTRTFSDLSTAEKWARSLFE